MHGIDGTSDRHMHIQTGELLQTHWSLYSFRGPWGIAETNESAVTVLTLDPMWPLVDPNMKLQSLCAANKRRTGQTKPATCR